MALGVVAPTPAALVPTWAAPTWAAGTWAREAEKRAAPISAAEESAAVLRMGNPVLVLLALGRFVDAPGARSWSGLPDMGQVVFQELPRALSQFAAFPIGPLGNRVSYVFRRIAR
jgi:hypothetical protein